MRRIRLVSLFMVMLMLLVTLSACHCEPSSEEWHLYSYVKKTQFIGGVERDMGFSTASVAYPFCNADFNKTKISFSSGNVHFSTWEGEALEGTYTYEHIGNYTRVYMSFSNGETAEGDAMKGFWGESRLVFKFRDVQYTFSDNKIEAKQTLEEIVKTVKDGKTKVLHPATVSKTEGGYNVRFSEIVSYFAAEDTAVYAIKIASDGSYSVLEEILEGEVLSTYNEDANYVVLYYVEK